MLSNKTFRNMMMDFVKAERSPGFKWRYDLFLEKLGEIIKDPKDFDDAVKYMHGEIDCVDTIVTDWILEAMCKTLIV